MGISLSRVMDSPIAKYSASVRSGEPDWAIIPSAKKSNKSQEEFVNEIKALARADANTASEKESESIHRKRTELCAEYVSDVSPDRKALYQQAKNVIKSQCNSNSKRYSGIGDLNLFDYLYTKDGKDNDFAEKKFALAGGGTLVRPILTEGGYGADIYDQGTQVLSYVGLKYGWSYEATPAEQEKQKEFYGIYYNEYHAVKNSKESEPEERSNYSKGNSSIDLRA